MGAYGIVKQRVPMVAYGIIKQRVPTVSMGCAYGNRDLHMCVCVDFSDNTCGVLVTQVLTEYASATSTTGNASATSTTGYAVHVNVLSKRFNVCDWIHTQQSRC